jgi:hypothetical protein
MLGGDRMAQKVESFKVYTAELMLIDESHSTLVDNWIMWNVDSASFILVLLLIQSCIRNMITRVQTLKINANLITYNLYNLIFSHFGS